MKFQLGCHQIFLGFGLVSMVAVLGCQSRTPQAISGADSADGLVVVSSKPTPNSAVKLIRSDYEKGEVSRRCQELIDSTKAQVAQLVAIKDADRTFDNTMLAFESIMAEFTDGVSPLTFMKYVSPVAYRQQEGADCEQKVSEANVEISTNRPLYLALISHEPRTKAEQRLVHETRIGFELSGMGLSDADLKTYMGLSKALSKLENDYSNELAQDKSHIEVTVAELRGVPQSFIDAAKRTKDGKVIVNANEADYPLVMENCEVAATRKKLMLSYLNRGAPINTKRLEDAIVLREKIAALVTPTMKSLGPNQRTWADYRIAPRMAHDKTTVLAFSHDLEGKLAVRNRSDLKQLLAYKKEIEGKGKAVKLNQWDIDYLANVLTKRDYSVDGEKVREYFPADVVISGLLSVYSDMLSVKFKDITDSGAGPKVWADGVRLYEIRNQADSRLIGYFYTDFYPRPGTGRYDHAAAFPLIAGRLMPDGYYSLPISAIVANFSSPANGQPALLHHDEVETVFHEFGHIMHQTLTRAPFASLSGANVAQDFVEAPSQMLENWVWEPEIIARLSGHYKNHAEKLPAEMLTKMLAARDFQEGRMYTKQLLYGLFDMTIHTQKGPVDVTKSYDQLYREIMGEKPIAGGHMPASFGHLMGGYDAGYYGYLWSKVYAQDMFTVFKTKGLVSPLVGGSYRSIILEHGNMVDASVLLRQFLGREPNSKAFFTDLHIN